MQRRSVAIAVTAATLVVLAGSTGWERFARTSERMALRTSLPPHSQDGAKIRPSFAQVEPNAAAVATPSIDVPRTPTVAAPTTSFAAPSFDIVRVEPGGEAIVAGRAVPDSTVALVDRTGTVAEARADGAGNFVMTPPALQPGDHALSLRSNQSGASAESLQSVIVSIPTARSQPVVVALSAPNQPTKLLTAPPEATLPPVAQPTAEPANVPPSRLAIRSVELENGSGLFASGDAPAGTDVRLYLNDSRIADVIAAAAGAWTVTVRRGLAAGRYIVRADSLAPEGSVSARVEVPFDVPVARELVATAPRGAPPHGADTPTDADVPYAPSPPPAGKTSRADGSIVVEELQTELVARGDNLWRISRKRLGFGTRYTQIYAVNAHQIRDPRLIYPGQVFVLPR